MHKDVTAEGYKAVNAEGGLRGSYYRGLHRSVTAEVGRGIPRDDEERYIKRVKFASLTELHRGVETASASSHHRPTDAAAAAPAVGGSGSFFLPIASAPPQILSPLASQLNHSLMIISKCATVAGPPRLAPAAEAEVPAAAESGDFSHD